MLSRKVNASALMRGRGPADEIDRCCRATHVKEMPRIGLRRFSEVDFPGRRAAT